MSRRLHAAGIHLFVSVAAAVLAATMVFFIWYPPPFSALAGGMTLLSILVSVDVAIGPALTALVASPQKPWRELRRDITFIVLVQLVAFAYGMYTIAAARPAYLVFEVDRFVSVSAADIDSMALRDAASPFRRLSWTGPRTIAAARSKDSEGMLKSLEKSLSGIDIAMQPDHWIEYDQAKDAVWTAARPIALLKQRYPQITQDLRDAAARAGVAEDTLRFLPLTSRKTIWTAVVAQPDSRIVAYLPVDGFL